MRTVITFYDTTFKLSFQDVDLVKQWSSNWESYGWKVEVKNLNDARIADPVRYKRYREAKSLYIGCDSNASFLCYARWLPLLNGGFMVDSDVFNYGFTPNDYANLNLANGKVLHFGGGCPCATAGTAEAYEKYIKSFDDYISAPYMKGIPDGIVHDQSIINTRPELFDTSPYIVSFYPDTEDWDRYPLIHYTHNGKIPLPRSRHVHKIKPYKGFLPEIEIEAERRDIEAERLKIEAGRRTIEEEQQRIEAEKLEERRKELLLEVAYLKANVDSAYAWQKSWSKRSFRRWRGVKRNQTELEIERLDPATRGASIEDLEAELAQLKMNVDSAHLWQKSWFRRTFFRWHGAKHFPPKASLV